MRKIVYIFVSLVLVLSLLSWQQPKKENPFHLEIVSNIADYQKSISSNPANKLVDLEKAMHSYLDLSPKALQNRQILRDAMSKFGFIPYESEWWHYDFKGWKNYPIMDLSFEELRNN
ncbi:MAG: hypothetical protein M0Q53_09960 [Prolixibacteraceae bacterium]|jgi:hypothetical protein|nr:hypothetical protein [Prolixibacteraceae bacterium]